jgi:hypothetical protein
VIECLSIREIVLEPTFKDFKIKYVKTLIFSVRSNEASVIDHIAPIFSIYHVELELNDRSVWYVHL